MSWSMLPVEVQNLVFKASAEEEGLGYLLVDFSDGEKALQRRLKRLATMSLVSKEWKIYIRPLLYSCVRLNPRFRDNNYVPKILASIHLGRTRKDVHHLKFKMSMSLWTPAVFRSVASLPSLRNLEGLLWPFTSRHERPPPLPKLTGLHSLGVWLDLNGQEVESLRHPGLWTCVDPSSLTLLSINASDFSLATYLEDGFFSQLLNLQDLRIAVSFWETEDINLARVAERPVLEFLSSKGTQLKRFDLHFSGPGDDFEEFPFDAGFLPLLSNVEFLSFSNASLFRQPFPSLPRLRTLFLGSLDLADDASVEYPVLPAWCSTPSQLRSTLTDLAGIPIPKRGFESWTSEKLPQLEELGDWSTDWKDSNPMNIVQAQFVACTLDLVGLSYVDRVGRRYSPSFDRLGSL